MSSERSVMSVRYLIYSGESLKTLSKNIVITFKQLSGLINQQ